MSKLCLICGKESDKWICDGCRNETNVDNLCNDVIAYMPRIIDNPNANPVWEKAAELLDEREKFSTIAYELADGLDSPRKEYQKIHSLANEYENVPKPQRETLYKIYDSMGFEGLSIVEEYRIKGLVLQALFSDYRYYEADDIASELAESAELPWQAFCSLIDYYNKTRRYEEAGMIIEIAKDRYNDNEVALRRINELEDKRQKYLKYYEDGVAKEFVPKPVGDVDKDEIKNNYFEFLESLGFVSNRPFKVPKPIPRDSYPDPVFIENPDFDSFVAYDVETTGLDTTKDCIIEIGAVKVVNGVITESKEFIFDEFVKLFKKSLKEVVSNITGITKEDLIGARPMWEVTPDFMEFVGDNVLVGYNNAIFDSKFLRRAGRYSNIVISNPQFDVLKYVRQIKKSDGLEVENKQLGTIAAALGIENPAAHRAWADALTTAKIYMKLKEMGK